MRTLIAAGVVLVALQAPAAAFFDRATNAPWCVQYFAMDGAVNCDFYTLQQCRAAYSGVGGRCFENPWSSSVERRRRAARGRYRH
jgi:hypothetical protein